MIEEACIQGVSTRSVDERVNALRMGSRIDAGHERPLMAVKYRPPDVGGRPLNRAYRTSGLEVPLRDAQQFSAAGHAYRAARLWRAFQDRTAVDACAVLRDHGCGATTTVGTDCSAAGSSASILAPDWHQLSPENKKVSRR